MKDRYEISKGSEILTNGKYKQLVSLHDIIPDIEKAIGQLLSIRIPIYSKNLADQDSVEQYNIETKKYITNITTHQGLDLHLTQYNKITKESDIYTPYSSPGYNVYVNLLCAYYEFFHKKPILNFHNTAKERWNKQQKSRDLPLEREMMFAEQNAYFYIHHYDLYAPDKQGISRIIFQNKEDNRNGEGFGICGDEAKLQFIDYFRGKSLHSFTLEKDLINLYLQAFIDTNRRVAGSGINLHLKKIADVIYTLLETPEARINNDFDSMKLRRKELE